MCGGPRRTAWGGTNDPGGVPVDLDVRRAELVAGRGQRGGQVDEEAHEAVEVPRIEAMVVGGVGVVAAAHQVPVVAVGPPHVPGQDVGDLGAGQQGRQVHRQTDLPAS
jgi:hypothetical protein